MFPKEAEGVERKSSIDKFRANDTDHFLKGKTWLWKKWERPSNSSTLGRRRNWVKRQSLGAHSFF